MTTGKRDILAALVGLAVTIGVNILGVAWVRGTDFTDPAFADGWAALLTLFAPSLLGGLLLGLMAKQRAVPVAAAAFGLFCVLGLVHPFWQIPRVSPQMAHNRLMHFLLYVPFVALAAGAGGAWVGEQFATGKWTLADRQPVPMPGLED